MQIYDYVILFDENGQPYIAHSVWSRVKSGAKAAGKTAHKYLLKVGEGAKARYAYTKEEVDALMGRGRQAVSDAAARTKEKVREVSGAANKAESVTKSSRDTLKTVRDKVEDIIGITAKREVESASEKDFNAGLRRLYSSQDASSAVEHLTSVKQALDSLKAEQKEYIKQHPFMSTKKAQQMHDQIKELEAVYERASRDAGRMQLRAAMDDVAFREAEEEYYVKVSRYLKTPLGALDLNQYGSIASKVERFLTDSDYGRRKISEILDTAKWNASYLINKTLGKDKQFSPDQPISPDILYADASKSFQALVDAATSTNVMPKTVATHDKPLSERKIISRISGGDVTEGSCSSLALTYIANKAGYNVLDFRGGESLHLFSSFSNIRKIAELAGENSHIIRTESAIDGAKQTLQFVENGKEYYFAAGSHAAIIKKDDDKLYYLELQNPNSDQNGWYLLDETVLTNRFNCRFSNPYGVSSVLIDTSSLASNKEFVSLLEYINTAEEEQKKGGSGSVK